MTSFKCTTVGVGGSCGGGTSNCNWRGAMSGGDDITVLLICADGGAGGVGVTKSITSTTDSLSTVVDCWYEGAILESPSKICVHSSRLGCTRDFKEVLDLVGSVLLACRVDGERGVGGVCILRERRRKSGERREIVSEGTGSWIGEAVGEAGCMTTSRDLAHGGNSYSGRESMAVYVSVVSVDCDGGGLSLLGKDRLVGGDDGEWKVVRVVLVDHSDQCNQRQRL